MFLLFEYTFSKLSLIEVNSSILFNNKFKSFSPLSKFEIAIKVS